MHKKAGKLEILPPQKSCFFGKGTAEGRAGI